ncbi:VrrA/YqfQ family protein [Sporosarcina thermotolerans]|uniref:VrrA/YqfQ family protein n=1 Tax=Sporosarcina thermotolerans TaxID=633404 RepID=UPI003D2F5C99
MQTANRFLTTAQQYAPLVQQIAPMFQNLPAMWRLYKGFQSLPTSGAAGEQVVQQTRLQGIRRR